MRSLLRILAYTFILAVCLFTMAPVLFVFLASLQHARYLSFPIEEYSLRWYVEALSQPEWRTSLWHSLVLAVQVTFVSTVVGTAAGLFVHYRDFRAKPLLVLAFMSPLLLPELLTCLALLFFFAGIGWSGRYVPLLLGHIIISFPFVLRMVLAALPNVTREMEDASRTLGANEFRTILRITLPLIGPAIRGGGHSLRSRSLTTMFLCPFFWEARV